MFPPIAVNEFPGQVINGVAAYVNHASIRSFEYRRPESVKRAFRESIGITRKLAGIHKHGEHRAIIIDRDCRTRRGMCLVDSPGGEVAGGGAQSGGLSAPAGTTNAGRGSFDGTSSSRYQMNSNDALYEPEGMAILTRRVAASVASIKQRNALSHISGADANHGSAAWS